MTTPLEAATPASRRALARKPSVTGSFESKFTISHPWHHSSNLHDADEAGATPSLHFESKVRKRLRCAPNLETVTARSRRKFDDIATRPPNKRHLIPIHNSFDVEAFTSANVGTGDDGRATYLP